MRSMITSRDSTILLLTSSNSSRSNSVLVSWTSRSPLWTCRVAGLRVRSASWRVSSLSEAPLRRSSALILASNSSRANGLTR